MTGGVFNYIDRPSPVHRLTGATKLVCLILVTFAAMSTFDTRLLVVLTVLGFVLLFVSKLKFSEYRVMFWFSFVFLVLNNLLIFLFSPEHGCGIYGSRTVICHIFWRYTLTWEQLFYHVNVILKYLVTVPFVLLFVMTTDPSEFASSLNRIGISYKIAYSVSLALRYIPDIQREYRDISLSQQARGLEMSGRKQSFIKRLKNAVAMLFPLIISSMDRIETIANAMELRGFGKGRKRTWYAARRFRASDITCIVVCTLLLAASLGLNYLNGSRYFNPFAA